jgi:AcrR family transcriptional regulator
MSPRKTPLPDGPKATHERRRPMQERSQETVERVLAGAGRLLSRRMPLYEMTTAMIAAEAGVSVGALYRFFADKQAIIDAIAARHMEAFQAGLTRQLTEAPPADGPALLGAVIDAFFAYLETHMDFRTVAYGGPGGGRYVSRPAREAYAAPDAGGAALVKWFMSAGMGSTNALDWRLRVATEAGDRLLGYALEQPDKADRRRVIDEVKRLLASYLFAP